MASMTQRTIPIRIAAGTARGPSQSLCSISSALQESLNASLSPQSQSAASRTSGKDDGTDDGGASRPSAATTAAVAATPSPKTTSLTSLTSLTTSLEVGGGDLLCRSPAECLVRDAVGPSRRQRGRFQVAIVGAGLAGLSAAQHLVANGVKDIVVLEARDRLGGRIHTLAHQGKPLELGAQWIHGGCPANSVFNLANKFRLLGPEVQRLHEETEDSEGDNPLKRWSTTKGYIYRPDGLPLSTEASAQAYQYYNLIADQAEHYHRRQYYIRQQPDLRWANSTRMSTFYAGRKRKALESVRKHAETYGGGGNDSAVIVVSEVNLALSGLSRALSVELGDDLASVRLELVGANAGRSTTMPGGHVAVPGGVRGLVDRLAADLPDGCLRLNSRVDHVDWSLLSPRGDPHQLPDKITLEVTTTTTANATGQSGMPSRRPISPASNTSLIQADFVICTMPLGVLQANHRQLFHPQLPAEKVQVLRNLGAGQMGKIFLEWTSPWWAPGEGGIQLAWPDALGGPVGGGQRWSHEEGSSSSFGHHPPPPPEEDLMRHWYRGIANFSEVDNQPNLLMCLIAGESARIADLLDDEEIMLTMADVLRTFVGDPGLEPPARVIRHRWTADPYSLGTWSYPSLTTEDSDFDTMGRPLPAESDPRLLFAGEATHGQFWGQMLGARLSGLREAQRVLDRIEMANKLAAEMHKISNRSPAASDTLRTLASSTLLQRTASSANSSTVSSTLPNH